MLFREILAGYELRRESASAERDLIHAQPKAGTVNSKYSAVLLEVDSRTHVVQRVVSLHGVFDVGGRTGRCERRAARFSRARQRGQARCAAHVCQQPAEQ